MGNEYRRNEVVTLTVEKMVQDGRGFGHLPDGRVVFVRGGAPGEETKVRLSKIKRDYAEGVVDEVITPSPGRVEPTFPIGDLAGATWPHLSYPVQLEAKEAIVREQLAWLTSDRIEAITPSPEAWRYRNKVEPSFGTNDTGAPTLGFYLPGRFDQIRPAADVALFPDWIAEVIRRVLDWANEEQLSVWDPRWHEGFLRNLVVRCGIHTEDRQVNIVTNVGEIPHGSFKACLHGLGITSLIHTVNTNLSGAFAVDNFAILDGSPYIEEVFHGHSLDYRFDSFFQTNTVMAEQVADRLVNTIGEIRPSVFIDAYGGVGTFGLVIASELELPVMHVEAHPQSYHDTKRNIQKVDVGDRMHAIRADVHHFFKNQPLPRDGFLFLDPPRAGLHPGVVRAIQSANLAHLGYLSCNVATLARDLALLDHDYEVISVHPFDFFPQTHHIETLVFLQRKTKKYE